jgi:hypothetical protein
MMSAPTGDNAFLHELELKVREELTLAQANEPGEGAACAPIEEWLSDPADDRRYEVSLNALLGAVKAMEDGSRPGVAAADLQRVRAADRPGGAARCDRMFPDLNPLGTIPGAAPRAGGTGGDCDAAAAGGHVAADDQDASEAAGWPFFAQLIAHDITAGRSPADGAAELAARRNSHAPQLDLEIIYSGGPAGAPYLFDRADPAKFLLSPDGRDVPRNAQGTALISDPRDDVHLFALTLHVALLRAHNRIVDLLRADGTPEADVFDQARVTLTWHYQWIIIHDFLPRLVGASLVGEVLASGGRWFAPPPRQAYIPLEFSHAAFRYGHGQIRHAYRLADGGPAVPMFPDLTGLGPPPPGRDLDLSQVFDLPGRPPAQRARRIDGRLAASLAAPPAEVTGVVDDATRHSLAARDLLRGQTAGLPSGEAVARLTGATPLTADELGHPGPHGTPLWSYILKEAEHRGDGDRLGPVGGLIVTETLVGLLRANPASYLSLTPDWRPTLPAAHRTYSLADLLTLGNPTLTT